MSQIVSRFALAVLFVVSGFSTVSGQNTLGDEAIFISVQSPITSETVTRIRNIVDSARNQPSRPVRKVVFDFNPNGRNSQTADFGTSYELAKYIRGLSGLTTIGFATAEVSGHSVLPLLACNEIVVGRDVKIGDVLLGSTEAPSPTMIAGYEEILGTPRAQFRAVVRKMFDRNVSLGKGDRDGVTFFVDLRDKAKLETEGIQIPDPTPLSQGLPGSPGIFDAAALRALGLSTASAESRAELADLFSLSTGSIRGDLLDGRPPVAFRYVLSGPIDGAVRESVTRVVKDVARQKGNLLFLVLEGSGGDTTAALDLANRLLDLSSEPDPVLVVAVVPDRAPDTATIVALGCGEIVMSLRRDVRDGEPRESEIGDFEALLGNAATKTMLQTNLRELAERQGYPELLLDGMVNPELGIVRVHAANDRSRRKLLTIEEFEADKANWVSDGVIKPKGQLLRLNASRAYELGLARYIVNNSDLAEVYALYGLDATKVQEATPGFLDRFATFLRIPSVTVLLVVIGFAGLILELKVPGTTIPGIIAALAFILVFWAQSQFTGQNAVLGGMIFLLGLSLVLIEVFVLPGFGVAGITGILFMLGGIVLATFDRIPQSSDEWMLFGGRVSQFVGALVGAVFVAFIIARQLPNIPYANRLVLPPPVDSPTDAPILPGAAEAAALLGAIGTSATPLRPAGMAQFGDKYIDVVTEGDFINSGARIQVIEIEGTRIVVKEV